MEKVKINAFQLFSLLLLFQLGTSVVVGFGMDAKKDAWIAILIGAGIGLLLYLMYYQLFKLYSKPLTGYLQDMLGKYVGSFIGILYITYFLYGAARDLRDVGDLLIASVYDQTPLLLVNLMMAVTIAYVLYKGIVVLARTAEIYLFIIIVLGMIGNFVVLISGIMEIKNVLPVLEEGWAPVLLTVFPSTTIFPHGELICFTLLFPYLDNRAFARKVGIYSIFLSGLILSYSTSLNIAVLGIDIAEEATFPLFTTVGLVNIADFIQRLDIIVVLTLFIGAFFKTALFYYAAVIATSDLFKISHKKLVMPYCIIILFLSIIIAKSFSEHLEEGKVSLATIHALFSVYIPLFLIFIALFQKKRHTRESDTISSN